MHVHAGVFLCCNAEYRHDFIVRCGRSVVDAHADGQRAALETVVNLIFYFFHFLRSGLAMRGIPGRQKIPWVVHHFHTNRNVPCTYTKVDQRLAFSLGVPAVHVVGANFEFERSSYAIVRLKLIVARFLGMLMKIDEARRDDQTLSVENSRSF